VTWGNLFAALPTRLREELPALREEIVDVLAETPGVRIERIVSTGQATPPGEWHDGERDEWVALLAGAARLRFADEAEPRALAPGDWVRIPAHARHRVEWTDPARPTVWLAVHFVDH
jgi:cupin 2 domain-containing protein